MPVMVRKTSAVPNRRLFEREEGLRPAYGRSFRIAKVAVRSQSPEPSLFGKTGLTRSKSKEVGQRS